jgi:ribosomal-protein-alanine N-acetyltransferase
VRSIPIPCFLLPKREKYNSSMSELPLRIRNFQVDDLEALYQIDRICFPADIAFSRAELNLYVKHAKSIAWVAEGPDGILGFVLARIENPSCAHVMTLDVVPEARQRKIGTWLMNTLHSELMRQGIGATILEVGVRNFAARRLYEKLNYKYLGTLPGYYHGREDAYRMLRAI